MRTRKYARSTLAGTTVRTCTDVGCFARGASVVATKWAEFRYFSASKIDVQTYCEVKDIFFKTFCIGFAVYPEVTHR